MDTQNKISNILSNASGVALENIDSNTNIYNDLGLDSLDITEVVMDIEKGFKIRITHDEVYTLNTIEDIVRLIKEKKHEL